MVTPHRLSTFTTRTISRLLKPFGYSLQPRRSLYDMALVRSGVQAERLTIVDIGANVCQGLIMAEQLARQQQLAIHCHAFEPIRASFQQLQVTASR